MHSMLKIFNFIKNNKKVTLANNTGKLVAKIKHYPPANKEWTNSVYTFNKNFPKFLPVFDKITLSMMKSFFNLYNAKIERKVKFPLLRNWMRRLSTTRILISKAELKHTNDKIIINLYAYNRQERYLKDKMERGLFKSFIILKKKIKLLKKNKLQLNSQVKLEKNTLLKTKWNDSDLNDEKDFIKNFFKKALKKEILYIQLKQLMFLNKFKFKSTYLLLISNIINKIYNKKIEFNIVTLKNFYLNSSIFTQILAIKLKKRTNRVLTVLSTSLRKIKLPSLKKSILLAHKKNNDNKDKSMQNLILKNLLRYNQSLDLSSKDEDNFSKTLNIYFPTSINSEEKKFNLESTILNSIKHKAILGVRIEAAGRLTRRITAARSTRKLKYVGNIKNWDSSYLGKSSVILRGNLRSNIQYTKANSKTIIGAFGLKGWVTSI